MKIFTLTLLLAVSLTTSAMAFSIPTTTTLNPKNVKLKTCMLQEAKQALEKGILKKDNIEAEATKIATTCAAQVALKVDNTTIELATTVIKSLLK